MKLLTAEFWESGSKLIMMIMDSVKSHFLLLGIVLILMSQILFGHSIPNGSENEPSDNRPLLQKIEGVWVSDLYTTEEYSGLPILVLVVRNGIARLDIMGYGYAEILVSNSPSDIPKEERTIAQRITQMNAKSLYVAWSSERLKVPNREIVMGLSQTGGDVAHAVTKQGTNELFGNSLLGEMGSDITSRFVSDIVSNIIADAFAPSKKIYVLEMNIRPINEYELNAHATIQEIKIKGQEKPEVTKIDQVIQFTKYDPASGVFFDIPNEERIYIPGEGLLSEIPKKYQQIGKSYIKYCNLKVPTHISLETLLSNYQNLPSNYSNANPFNKHQIKKIQYFNEQKILYHGYEHSISKPYLGVLTQEREGKKGKKGCYVYQVIHSSPAYLFDIQEGDILQSIDGYEIEKPEQVEKLIESLKPFEWVNICLKRRTKNIRVEAELSSF